MTSSHWERRVGQSVGAIYVSWLFNVLWGITALIVVVFIFIIAIGIRVIEDGERLRTGRPF